MLVVSETPLTTFHLYSNGGEFDASHHPDFVGVFESYDEQNLFNLDPRGVRRQEFAAILATNLTVSVLLSDLEVDGSLFGGGGLGEVGLVCLNCFDGVPATVQGQVYDDVNRNGQQDPGEAGVDGWTVQLVNSGEFAANVRVTTSSIDLNEDGQIDPLTETGIYQFTGFGPGQVTATIQTPVGWVAQPGPALEVNVAEGAHATLPASGYYQQQTANIVVQVFEDANGDGIWDEDEPALEAIRIRLDSSAGTSEIEYTELQDLDQDGSVSVDEAGALFQVLPGSYDLTSALRDTGWTFTDDAQGDYAFDVAEAETVVIHVGQQGPVRGDLNGDRTVDSADVDALYQAIRDGSRDLRYDLTGDRRIDRSDMVVLVEDILGTSIGDVNFDGRFDSADLVLVLQAGQYEDNVADNSTYRTGDWTGNGEFDAFDLVFAFQRGGFVREAVAATSVRGPFATTNPELAAALQPIHRIEETSVDSDQTHHQHRLQTVGQKIQLQDRIFASLFV
ncbi:MAG: SdrD B-like domain-containing protein [Pirellulaceae bacterium]